MIRKSIWCAFLILLITDMIAQIPSDGLIAYYPFNNAATDESVNNNDAILNGCSFSEDRFGQSNKALELDLTTDQAMLPLEEYTPLTGDFSISIWFKTKNQIRSHIIELGYWIGGDGDGGNFQINLLSGTTLWAYWNGLGDNSLITTEVVHVNDNKWHNLVITRASGFLSLYVDRKFMNMMPWAMTYYDAPIGDDEPILIGNTENAYRGMIDDIAIYNIALDQTEVNQIFHDQQSLVILSPAITDRYPQNTNCRFQWLTASSIATLDLDYSVNNGLSWIGIAEAVNTEDNYYDWNMPEFPIGIEITVRISDSNNEDLYKIVGPFKISEYHWEEVNTSCAWLPRDGAGLLNFQDKLWLLGGWNPFVEEWLPGNTCSEIWNSIDGENWSFVGDAPWQGRHTAGWLVHEDMMWVIGGDWNSGVQQMDVWNSADGVDWNLVLDTLPMEVRMTHMVASLNGEMVYFGGQTLTFLQYVGGVHYNDVWKSDDGIEWQELTENAGWHPRGQVEGHFVRNDTLWLIGGGTYDARYMYSDVWYSADGANWTMVTEAAAFTPRQYHEVGVFDNRLWILGGYEGVGNRNDVWYSDNGADWYELKNTPWPGRHASGVCSYDSSLWLISGNLWNDSWRLRKAEVPTFITTSRASSGIHVYPNPASDIITIQSKPGSSIVITDMMGKIQQCHIQKTENMTVNISELNNGIYMVIEFNNSCSFIEKFIIQKD